RGAAVEGQVFDQDNEPLSKVVVQLSRIRTVRGKRKLVPSKFVATDDRGQFRLFDIPPGRYYLGASYRSFGVVGKPVGAGQPKTYPITYYPGVVELQEATKIQVPAGADIGGMNFTLMEIPSYTISGKILVG